MMTRLDSELWVSKSRKDFAGLDVNRDGYIDRSDLAAQADAMAIAFGHAAGSDEAAAFLKANEPWFEMTMTRLGKGPDDRVSLDEYVALWAEASDEEFEQVLEPWVACVLGLAEDSSRITKAEFARFSQAMGGASESEVDGIFDVLDAGSKGYLSADEFGDYMLEFAITTDRDAPANVLYGSLA